MKVPMSNLQLEILIKELQKRLARAEAQIGKLRWSADGFQDSNDPRENDDAGQTKAGGKKYPTNVKKKNYIF